ncbi:S41 family peptidase [Pleionea litopenaei]|uniref:S41 family peptidase n=1 Tax=Pleionea litopenaei TaxID=3070815 RepID=A0AA51RR41_9GAMM|nr:S41 family peptidase [Pleionea sp. HL-JVS1]WMS85993.1 S41 family peptidase [Pleionea sp. HL-JVS1]
MFLKKALLVSLSTFILAGCSNSDNSNNLNGSGEYPACSLPDQNLVWFDYLKDWYLFYSDLPDQINPEGYVSIEEMLNAVRSPDDRFSYVLTRAEYDEFFNSGSYFGYGFSSNTTQVADAYVIRYVFSGSGADQAGLKRGDRLIEINGYTATEIKAQNLSGETVYGPDQDGYTIDITYINSNDQTISTQMTKGQVSTNTVFDVETFNTSAGTVGYLSFQHGFIEPSAAELNQAFATLSAVNPSQLILDLRYNGGGRISIAEQLGSLIGGDTTSGSIFGTLEFNDKHSDQNSTYYFDNLVNKLDISRLIVLTTENTCSASEMIINGIDPFIEVVTVGDTTCGKPIGMSPQEYCEMVMSAINFKVTNANGFGDYFNGINAQCNVTDQIVADWGSLQDPVFAEGLYFAENDACSNVNNYVVQKRSPSSQQKSMKELLFDNRY